MYHKRKNITILKKGGIFLQFCLEKFHEHILETYEADMVWKGFFK